MKRTEAACAPPAPPRACGPVFRPRDRVRMTDTPHLAELVVLSNVYEVGAGGALHQVRVAYTVRGTDGSLSTRCLVVDPAMIEHLAPVPKLAAPGDQASWSVSAVAPGRLKVFVGDGDEILDDALAVLGKDAPMRRLMAKAVKKAAKKKPGTAIQKPKKAKKPKLVAAQ